MAKDRLDALRVAFTSRRYILTWHATERLEERKITPREVEETILSPKAEIIEDYPNDPRGPSCLVLGETKSGRIMHVQVTYPPLVWVVTVYEPEEDKWRDPRIRRR